MSSMKRTTGNANKGKDNRTVRFGGLEIVEFNIILGDNPSCSSGAPIHMGFEVLSSCSRNLELYEHLRCQERRRGKQLAISVPKRAAILLDAGYSMGEIAEATLQVGIIKKKRRDSMSGPQGWDKIRNVLETTGKLPKGIMNGVIGTMRSVVVSPSNKPKEPTARSA